MSFTRILVPLDFSAASDEALRVAAGLAARSHAALHLMHVLPTSGLGLPAVPVLFMAQQLEDAIRDALAALETARTRARELGVADVATAVVHGTAATEIVAAARRLACDLVVVGSQGRTGLAGIFVGSVADAVVHRAPCSVLMVRVAAH